MTQEGPPDSGAPPLAGILVVERADRLAVSVCGSLLAELGATVVQVPGHGFDIGLTETARAAARSFDVGKRTIVPEGEEDGTSWPELVKRADVVLLTSNGQADAELIERESPHRIVCSVTAFGIDAAPGSQDADETALQALGGIMAATGLRGGAPERANVPLVEMFTALNAATTILGLLRSRGKGFADMAAFDSAVAMLTTYVSTVEAGRADGYRLGCGHHLCSPWNVYPAADGWVQICSTTDEQWRAILRLMDKKALYDDPRFSGGGPRLQHAAEVDELIGGWTAGQSAEAVVRILLDAGLPAGRVRTISQLVEDQATSPVSFLRASLAAAPAERRVVRPRAVQPSNGREPADDEMQADSRPLEGIRVIEVGPYTAGPLAGRYLADLGAEVIKVEPPGGEVSRFWRPQFGGHSGYFVNCNAGKASVVLDLKSRRDLEQFLELVRTADVFIESLRPGALDKIGLGPDKLMQIAPRLVHCAISGFGRQSGSRPALDSVVQAEAGLMWLVGDGERPQRVGISIADQAAAHAAPLLILAALLARERSGEGTRIDLAMQDVLAWIVSLARPDGKPTLSPCRVMPASDGWVAVTSGLAQAEAVLRRSDGASREEAVRLLTDEGVGAVVVRELGEVFSHEAVLRRGLVQRIETEAGVSIPVLSSPHRLGLSPLPVGRLSDVAGSDSAALIGRRPD